MTGIIDTRHHSWLLWNSMTLLVLITICNIVVTTASPLPETFFAEIPDNEEKNFHLHRPSVNDKKLMEKLVEMTEQLMRGEREQHKSSYYPAQSEYSDDTSGEMLPVPSAQHAPDKRINYMTLCHFKLCNMARIRQS